jgi:sigma-E factor negative regulatory protein RseA
MNEQLRQSLSAVVDGEADAFELRRVLDELDRDPELRATWMRYHLIGSVIRGEHAALRGATPDRLGQPLAVAAEIASSRPTHAVDAAADTAGPRAPGVRARAGLLTAASAFVALSALVSGLLLTGSDTQDQRQSAGLAQPQSSASQLPSMTSAVAPSEAQPGEAQPGEAQPGEAQPAPVNEQWVQAYMLQHAQQQGLDQRGVISLVRPATYSVP